MPACSRTFLLLLAAAFVCQAGLATAVEPREFVDDKGNKVRETTETVKRNEWVTQYTDQQQTVLRPELKTEYQTQVRQYQVPITETVLVPELVNRWNPFATPHYEYKQQQRTRYELKQETIQVPIVRQEMKQSQETVKVPKLVQREVEEQITRRVVVRDLPAAAAANTQLAKLPAPTAPINNMATAPATIPTIRANTSVPPAALPAAINPAPTVARRDPFAPQQQLAPNFQQPGPNTFQPNNNASIARRNTPTTIPPPATAPSAMLAPRTPQPNPMPNGAAPNGYSAPSNPPGPIPTNAAPGTSIYNVPPTNSNMAAPTVPGRYQ
jgi:hypothetical protein